MYLVVCGRLDIAYAVGVVSHFSLILENDSQISLSRFNTSSSEMDSQIFRGIFRVCLCFGGDNFVLQVYIDADIADDVDFRKSLLGYLLIFVERVVSW